LTLAAVLLVAQAAVGFPSRTRSPSQWPNPLPTCLPATDRRRFSVRSKESRICFWLSSFRNARARMAYGNPWGLKPAIPLRRGQPPRPCATRRCVLRCDRPAHASRSAQRAEARHAGATTVQRVGRCDLSIEHHVPKLLRWSGPTRAQPPIHIDFRDLSTPPRGPRKTRHFRGFKPSCRGAHTAAHATILNLSRSTR
jgi:hypothetical protein